MVIKILGGGCANCKKLEENTKKALKELRIDAKVIKVKEYKDIMSYGVMRTPALVINERVVSCGRVLIVNEIINILKNY
ncbi:thioredoxin family protein [Clostridium manihotivorum]|uniref:Redox-active disulfide protein 2 n=1 Tax=Clostridium manihotivorum TaxID=2320868 RepID=A0A3R5U653_9CLOT|nr:thioredoxin family protein [Clostridium manihotivorum]QAA32781.1 redox-active disulfide protein 2 [Clostridium manihotivorum]